MAKSITQAMKSSGVSRAVYMATAGIEGEFKGPMKWLLNAMIGNVIADHKEAAKYYRQEGLKATILRPMQLSDKDHTGIYVTADEGLPKARKAVSRANVADLIIACLEDDKTIGQSIAVAEK
jgi:nucleoside-diphosphate-sugar epimerase